MDWGKLIGLTLLGVATVSLLSQIANNRAVNPNLRLLARTAEGDIVQDMETGLIHLLV
jgi:hypothetical protein